MKVIQEQLRQLFELSQVDRQIRAIRQKIAHVPVRREELTTSLRVKEEALAKAQERLAEIEKQKRGFEGELQLAQNRLSEFQAKVNQIKTNREYQAALKEIAETKKGNQEVEGKILGLMAELERLQAEVTTTEPALQTERAAAQQELKTLEADEKTIEEEAKDFELKKAELRKRVDGRWLAHYDRIFAARDEGVAVVERGTCQGCHMHVPPQLLIEIQRARTIHTCPSCQRILYIPGGNS